MRIRCYGTRGSIPVSGPDFLKYGGDTTCLEILTEDGQTVVVDAGSGIRRLGGHLVDERRLHFHLLFTHSHWDHIIGFTVFKPNYLPQTRVRIWYQPDVQGNMFDTLSSVMHPPGFPIRYDRIDAKLEYSPHDMSPFRIGSMEIHTIATSHTAPGLGYKFIENGKQVVFLTDNELGMVHPLGRTLDEYRQFAADADLLIHDAQYTPEEYVHRKGRGHSSWKDVADLARAAGVRRVGLFHHHPEHTDDDVDAIAEKCRAVCGPRTRCSALRQGQEFRI
jgi:phosphoribosyl 1,2-cyclic phosphodiesterase